MNTQAELSKGTIGYVAGAFGVVSSEEPQAALVARDILSAGGTAADAATAMGFTLAVTMPSAGSLGGGGVCLVRSSRGGKPEVIDFLPRAPKSIPSDTERPSAVPATPRGLFLIHSRYGTLSWEQVISPAEKLARFGFNVPRALAMPLGQVADALLRDRQAASVFQRKDGGILQEGDFLKQPELAAVLGGFRSRGVGDFYLGNDAAALVKAVVEAGGSLSVDDLRDYRPIERSPLSFDWEKRTTWHFAGPPSAGGAVAAEMMAILMHGARFEKADGPLREHLLAEAAKRAFADRMKNMQADGTYRSDAAGLVAESYVTKLSDGIADDKATPLASLVQSPVDWPETPAAVSFAVIDMRGGAAACTLTMNNIFGNGRMLPGYGIMMAAAPDVKGRTFTPTGPVMLSNEDQNRVYLAAASSGGVSAPTALVNVLARAAAGPQSLRDAMNAPRTHYGGQPDKVFVEAEMPAEIIESLRTRGNDVALTKSIGVVSAAYCPTGVPSKEGVQCFGAADPRGFGISFGGN